MHSMSRTLTFAPIITLLFSLSGCSSSSTTNAGTSGTCNAPAACGGALDGTWAVDSVCVEGNLTAAMNKQLGLPSTCDTTFQSVSVGLSGTVTFANNTETDNLTQTMDAHIVYTAACESAVAGQPVTLTASICTTIQQQLMGTSGAFTTAACSLSNGSCDCTASKSEAAPTVPQPYTVSGHTITYTGTDPSDPIDYCVYGTTLTGRQTYSGLAGIWTVTTLRKQ